MEQLTVYDAQKQPTAATMLRDTPVPNDGYRVVVSVLLFNETGELLIQKRQSTKKAGLVIGIILLAGPSKLVKAVIKRQKGNY